ncbi:MAG: DEAD/DEAH box helicase [Planctomycetales bacterium]|nr:DEAD/DEAH box helicase [Planctomycetales bacterium]
MNPADDSVTTYSWSPPTVDVATISTPPCAPTATVDESGRLALFAADPPAIVSLPIRPLDVKVQSFCFDPAAQTASTTPDGERHAPPRTTQPLASPLVAPPASAAAQARRKHYTRVRPPGDMIKLVDRLRCVLEPPLETLLGRTAIEMPAAPFPYQLEGMAFLYPRHAAVLADEMGLGKTMQAITSIRLLLRSGEARSVLLVCPKPLVHNWQAEFARWAPEIPLTVVEGPQARRAWFWGRPHTAVAIANYELVQRDEALAAASPAFDLVVLDEAQRIKNAGSNTARAVRSLARSRSWALTGTPMENAATDVVGIFEFVAPGLVRPDMPARRIGEAISDHVIRRTTEQVLTELPPKLFRDAELSLSPEQWDSYRLAEDEGVVRLAEMHERVTIQHVFELVLRLKQICNYDPATGTSAKLERLEADLEEVAASGQKAIVFSQWVGTLGWLAERLARYRPLSYHGRVPARRRPGILEQFRDDADSPLLLLSYGAGGVGLNLQFARYAFLFDRWWNPAVEDQAVNRVHRIGSGGPVTISRFVTLGTIEERIEQILQEKRDLFDLVFDPTRTGCNPSRLGLSREEIFGLFKLTVPGGESTATPKAVA